MGQQLSQLRGDRVESYMSIYPNIAGKLGEQQNLSTENLLSCPP